MDASSLIEAVRRHLAAEAPEPGALRRALAARLTIHRKRRGMRHELAPGVAVLVAGAACRYRGPLAIAEAAARWAQAAGRPRLPGQPGDGAAGRAVGADAVPGPRGPGRGRAGAALTAALADAALAPQVTPRPPRSGRELGKREKKRKQPPAAELPPGAGGRLVPSAPALPFFIPLSLFYPSFPPLTPFLYSILYSPILFYIFHLLSSSPIPPHLYLPYNFQSSIQLYHHFTSSSPLPLTLLLPHSFI